MARYFYLTPMLGGPGAPSYLIGEQSQLIGRSDRAEISLLEPTVSRQHATVYCQDGGVMLKDLGSKHGTFVNSKRVTTLRLKVGDIVVFGLSLVLRLEESDKPIPTADAPRPLASGVHQEYVDPHTDMTVTAVRTMTLPPKAKKSSAENVALEDPARMRKRLAEMHKLAAAGALCLVELPPIETALMNARATLKQAARSRKVDGPEALAALDAALALVNRLDEALGVLPPVSLEVVGLATVSRLAIDVVRADADARQVKLALDVGEELRVQVEPHRLSYALVELLRNAVQASRAGQIVELTAAASTSAVSITVRDDGPGVPASIVERAFDPFVTHSGDVEALGLGLYQARQIVLSWGGSIQLESPSGGGTMVHVVLPFPG